MSSIPATLKETISVQNVEMNKRIHVCLRLFASCILYYYNEVEEVMWVSHFTPKEAALTSSFYRVYVYVYVQ